MKLISNYKDYYDYLVGIYGIDEKAIYNRTNKLGVYKPNFIDYPKTYGLYMFAVCGVIYVCFYDNKNIYYGQEAIGKIEEKWDTGFKSDKHYIKYHLTKTNINDIEGEPILLVRRNWENGWDILHETIKLSDFQFSKVLKPEEIYLQINNFLLREKEIIDNRTDKEHIESAGFDYRESFRNIK